MNILDLLNSGALHQRARQTRPECVDARGNVHVSASRARFVDWLTSAKTAHGADVTQWPETLRAEYERRYVPSH